MSTHDNTICPFCLSAVGDDAQVSCSSCGSAHHADCFAEGGGCAVLGCQTAESIGPDVWVAAVPAMAGASLAQSHASPPTPPAPPRPAYSRTASNPPPAQNAWPSADPVAFDRADQPSARVVDVAGRSSSSSLSRWVMLAGTALLAGVIGFTMGTGSAQSAAGDSWSDGYNSGHEVGYESGKSKGYTDGKSDGYDSGFESGKTQGYSEGKSDGYDSGYEAGKGDAQPAAPTDTYDSEDPTSEYSSGVVYVDELSYGTWDSDSVRRLQWVLQQEGYDLEITGDYDTDTDAAVRAWQESIGNKPDAVGASSLGSGQATRLFEDHGSFTVV